MYIALLVRSMAFRLIMLTSRPITGMEKNIPHERNFPKSSCTRKYLKTAPILNAVSQQIDDMLHTPGSVSSHHRESLNSSKVTEAKVNDIIYIVTNSMTDPFDLQHNEVIHIANVIIVSSQTSSWLRNERFLPWKKHAIRLLGLIKSKPQM